MKGRRKEDVLAAVQEDTERMLSSPGGTAQWSHAAALADRLQMDRANVARELNLLYQNGQLIKIQGKPTYFLSRFHLEQRYPGLCERIGSACAVKGGSRRCSRASGHPDRRAMHASRRNPAGKGSRDVPVS